MYAHLIALLIFAAVPPAARSEAWETEIDNSRVRVARRVVAPHETISVSDSAPPIFVFLTEYPVRLATAARQEERRGLRGQCFGHSGGKISLENPGEQRVEVARVVPKFGPAQSCRLPQANPQRVIRLVAQFNSSYACTKDAQGCAIPRLALPANYSFGDNFQAVDVRLSRAFVFRERWRLSVIGEVFNLYDAANLSGYSGDLTSAAFGQPTSRATQVFGSGGPRAFQLPLRVSF